MHVCRIGFVWCRAPLLLLVLLTYELCVSGTPARPADALREKNVLVLHAFEAGLPVFEMTHKGFDRTIESGTVSLRNRFFEYLDLARNPGPEYRKRLAELMRLRYGQRKVDVIVTFYPEALQFVIDEGRAIFSDVPIVALFLPPDFQLPRTRHHIIQLTVVYNLTGTLETALTLVPDATRVDVVCGAYGNDKKLEERARREFKKWEGRLEIRYLSDMPLEKILAAVADAPGGSLVFFGTFTADVTGANYTSREVAQRLSRVAKGPVFGLHDAMLGYGIVGGVLVSFENIGAQAGQLALKILEAGKVPENTPTFLTVPHIPMFDWRELKRWNLSVDAVPQGSSIVNKELSFWDFRYYIMGVLAFCLAETTLIAFLIDQRRRKKSVEEALGDRLRFERLITNLSADLVSLPPDEFDSRINGELRAITEFFAADRCSVALFSEDGTTLALALEYRSTETESAPESLSKDQLPWYVEQLIMGKPVVMNRVEDLPPAAENERRFCRDMGIKSVLSIPVVSGGKTQGSCALVATRTERVWSEDFIPRLRLLGETLIHALERKKAEEASREGERILRQKEHELRLLAGRLISAQEEERGRIARELHDDIAQRLAAFAIDVGKLEQRFMDTGAADQQELREMTMDIVKISQDVHSLSRQLHPSILDDLGLIKAVEAECTNVSRREGLEIVFEHENMPPVIPKDMALSAYRIIQEALNNISKHACAEHVSVALKGSDDDILLSVQDDGLGFDWADAEKQPGLGFSSMRERARLIHADLSIQSQPEKGTMITLRVPITR